jgi:hypothetical protein
VTDSANSPSAEDVLVALAFKGNDKQRKDALKRIEASINMIREFVNSFPNASHVRKKSKTISSRARKLREAIEEFPTAFVFHNTRSRSNWLAELSTLQDLAEIGTRVKGPSKNFGRAQHVCALHARVLVCELTRKSPTTTEGGPLRNAASVLFQIITGKSDDSVLDLKRACDWAVKEWRGISSLNQLQLKGTVSRSS